MKINVINNVKSQSNNKFTKRAHKDLTSFGINQEQNQNSELISKQTADVLKTNFLTNISFEGQTKTIERHSGSPGYYTSGYYSINNSGIYYSVENAIRSDEDFRKNSELIYTHNNNRKNSWDPLLVYFADPEENITEEFNKKYDCIVLDKEISAPSLEQLEHLFTTDKENHTDYRETYKEIYEYNERLKTATVEKLKKAMDDKRFQQEMEKLYKEELNSTLDLTSVIQLSVHQINIRHINEYIQNVINPKIDNIKDTQKIAVNLYKLMDEANKFFKLRNIFAKKKEAIFLPLNGRPYSELQEVINEEIEKINAKKKEHKIVENWLNLRSEEIANTNYSNYWNSPNKKDDMKELEELQKKEIALYREIIQMEKRLTTLIGIPDALAENKEEMDDILAELAKIFEKIKTANIIDIMDL